MSELRRRHGGEQAEVSEDKALPKDAAQGLEAETVEEQAESKAEPAEEKADSKDEQERSRPVTKQQPRPGRGRSGEKAAARNGVDADVLDKVLALMEAQQFNKAAAKIQQLLVKHPEDSILLHNLGVVYTEQGCFADAEEVFLKAWDAQKKDNKVNYATMYGLATVLTEQGTTPKLLQAEALFHDFLAKAIAQEERGVTETYQALTGLADCLEKQKRWAQAVEAWQASVELGTNMFGANSKIMIAHLDKLARAERLSRYQKVMRVLLWTITICAIAYTFWVWYKAGMPTPWGDAYGYYFSTQEQATGHALTDAVPVPAPA